ncbi:MAG: ADP-forming succinate--CoA ligase subunit beta, partial [Candidatus Omnitrophica bacterium]|nr:ADP-forming succinate--CoA ligase subunit beta [Candidatus Omnitrophota bacterium]
MKIHEFQARELFKSVGIPVSSGEVVNSVEEAQAVAQKLGYPVVLKAQVLSGGRGKAGGVKFVKAPADLPTTFDNVRRVVIQGYPVERIFVAQAVEIRKEFYFAITIDPLKADVVLIASAEGGVDIEQTAKEKPEAIHKFYFHGEKFLDLARWNGFVRQVFVESSWQIQATEMAQKLLKLFYQYDCSLAEINPLIVDDKGNLLAIDAKVNFDDNGLFRHPELEKLRDLKYEDADELEAKASNLSFVKLEGSVGCIVNGAGLAMATMDVIKLLGGQPANFLDVGGSSNPQKVLDAIRIILRNPKVKVILINIFGGITRCDDIAQGILEARKKLNLPVPLVVRLVGTNEEKAKAILAEHGI